MADVLYVAMMIALTAIGVMFVVGCDKIIGPDELALVEESRARERRTADLIRRSPELVCGVRILEISTVRSQSPCSAILPAHGRTPRARRCG